MPKQKSKLRHGHIQELGKWLEENPDPADRIDRKRFTCPTTLEALEIRGIQHCTFGKALDGSYIVWNSNGEKFIPSQVENYEGSNATFHMEDVKTNTKIRITNHIRNLPEDRLANSINYRRLVTELVEPICNNTNLNNSYLASADVWDPIVADMEALRQQLLEAVNQNDAIL